CRFLLQIGIGLCRLLLQIGIGLHRLRWRCELGVGTYTFRIGVRRFGRRRRLCVGVHALGVGRDSRWVNGVGPRQLLAGLASRQGMIRLYGWRRRRRRQL